MQRSGGGMKDNFYYSLLDNLIRKKKKTKLEHYIIKIENWKLDWRWIDGSSFDNGIVFFFFFSLCFHLPWKKTKC